MSPAPVPPGQPGPGASLWIDLETYAVTDLKKSNVYRYTEDPSFQILMAAWSVDGKAVHVTCGEDEIRRVVLPYVLDDRYTVVAHNAGFERVCLSRLAGYPTGTYLPSERFDDTAVRAAAVGYPQSLGKLARVLGVEEKDTAGTRLIHLFSKPNRKRKVRPTDKPDHWAEFVDYCRQDVATLIAVDRALPPLSPREQAVLDADQAINDRGITVDVDLAEVASAAAKRNEAEQKQAVRDLTGVDNPGSVQQLQAWLTDQLPEPLPNLQSATVTDTLAGDLPADVRTVLEHRQDLALTTSKKYDAALNNVCSDGQLRGTFRFYGAHTGRWSSRGVQLQNLTRASVPDVDAAIADLKAGRGADAQTLKGLIRPLFVGPFTVVDYAAVEARVLAWLAGERWVLEAFRAGRDIYVETADRMGGLTRTQGKVAVLALGYNGGAKSLRAMSGEGFYVNPATGKIVSAGTVGAAVETVGTDHPFRSMTDAELRERFVYPWRAANPAIVRFWHGLESAVRNGGRSGLIRVRRHGKDVHLRLPSGRVLTYHNMRHERYWDAAKQEQTEGWRFDDPRGFRQGTYGGRLAENVTQAVARDLLADALVRLEGRGYEVVAHIHDELLVAGDHLVDEVKKIVCEPPDWAVGLPIDGEGEAMERYKKA